MLGLACATLACAALLPLTSQAADEMKPMKGGEHLMMLNNIETKKQLDSLKTGDTLTMVCAKCKTVWTSRVRQGAKGAEILMARGQPQEVIGTHACKGCNSTLTVVGHTKGDVTELKHSCKACGDDSAFCCAAKGGGSTPGMEKK
jgi:hypothetical protein